MNEQNQVYLKEILEYYRDALFGTKSPFLESIERLLAADLNSPPEVWLPEAEHYISFDGVDLAVVGFVSPLEVTGILWEVAELIAHHKWEQLTSYATDSKTGYAGDLGVHLDDYGRVTTIPKEAKAVLCK